MPPKQVTLGYVRPAQTTLGKFFGQAGGANAVKNQQSKLSFSNNVKPKTSPIRDDHQQADEPDAVQKDERKAKLKIEADEGDWDAATTNVGNGKAAAQPKLEAGQDNSVKLENHSQSDPTVGSLKTSPHQPPLKTRKRDVQKRDARKETDEESDSDVPTAKRRRTSAKQVSKPDATETEDAKPVRKANTPPEPRSTGQTKSTATTTGKPGPKPKGRQTAAREDETDSKISSRPKQSAKQHGNPRAKGHDADKDSDESIKAEPKVDRDINGARSKPALPAKNDDGEDSSTQSVASEQDDNSGSEEDERPEASAKAREKVQSTLQSTGKDPYPDWKPGEPVPYAALCTTFSRTEMTTKRLEILAHCSLFLRQVLRLTPDDLLPVILLMINKLAADYAGIELGIGESLIMKAIGEAMGRSISDIKVDQKEIGDLGLVAAKSRGKQPTMFKQKPLTVRGVHESMLQIATVEGQGSQGRKIAVIKKLLSAADANIAGNGNKVVDIAKDKGGPSECKYLIRTLEGKMRLGLADKTVLTALAQAMVFHETTEKGNKIPGTEQLAKGESVLKSVYSELPSYEVIVPAMLKHGIFNLRENCSLRPGVPLKPMLAKPTKSITEVLDRFEGKQFTCEYKYDGERAQIHFVAHDTQQEFATAAPSAGTTEKGIANIFSRNSEDLSKKYPDILAKVPTWVKHGTKSFVLDCETVAWDTEKKHVLPFQQLMTRKRKEVKTEDVKVKVCVFAFDLLYLNGEALVNRSFRERRQKMYDAFTEVEGEFAFAQCGNSDQLEEIQTLLDESVKASCEGLMVKMLDGVESNYEPSRRSQNWLKVKKDYLSGVGDSLDLVVLGAYHGRGKRTKVYGAFLLACYDAGRERFESVCNIGTGFSEAVLEELHSRLSQLVIDRAKPFYSHSSVKNEQPDVWFEARQVWEVRTADLTLSPRYKAAAAELGEGAGKGISLRFPRFIRVREDKKAEEATSSRTVAEMYRKQERVGKDKGPSADDDFEY